MNKHFEQIRKDIETLGICKGDDLLIHASYKALGEVEGGIKTLIEAILSVLGEEGTLLMPALSYDSVHAMDEPTFDIKNTPACVGAIPEYFRTYPGVVRSMHPTHSVCALGARKYIYTQDHLKDNEPVGPNSPFALLAKFDGKVLMLGCGLKPNTSMHGIEEFAGVPYILSKDTRTYYLIDENGNKTAKEYYYHYIRQNGYAQRYDRLEDIFTPTKGKILAADCAVMDSAKMWEAAANKMREEPYFFTDKM